MGSRTNRKKLTILAPGMLLLLVLGLIMGCEEEKPELRQIFTEDDVAIEVARQVEILYSDSAVVRVRVTGPLLHNINDRDNPRQVFPEGIKLEFMQADHSIRSTLTAKSAVRQQDKGLITVRDSVVLNTVKGEKLETEELIWDEKSGKVHTEKFVKVSQPGEVIYGFGLEAEQDFSYWKILVPKGKIKVEQINELK